MFGDFCRVSMRVIGCPHRKHVHALVTYGNEDFGNLNVDDQDLAGRIGISG
jgi:hypothetical protein